MAVKTLLLSLLKKVAEPQAKMLTDYVVEKVGNRFDSNKEPMATRQDILDLHEAIVTLRSKQAQSADELLKWMIILFVPLYIGMIVLLVKTFTS